MKRRRMSSANPPRLQLRYGTSRGVGIPDSDAVGPATRRGEQALRKRVKFASADEDLSTSFRDGGHWNNNVETTARRSDQPKTAEYAFFQKLKAGDAQTYHPHRFHLDEKQSGKLESHEAHRESYGVVHGSDKDGTSSMLIKKDIPPKANSFVSPMDNSLTKTAVDMIPAPTFSPNIFAKHKHLQEYRNAKAFLGADGTRDVFSRKRENLLRWLKTTLFPETENISLEGCNFMSLLLNRLSGKSDEDNVYKIRHMDQTGAADTIHEPFSFDSDIRIQEVHKEPTKEFADAGLVPFWGYGSSSTWPSDSRETIFSVYDSPSPHGIVPWSRMRRLGYTSSENDMGIVPYAESDLAVDFPIEEGSNVSLSHLRNMKDFPGLYSNGSFLKGGLQTPRMPWNIDEEERNSLIICPHEEFTRDPTRSLDFWCNDLSWSIEKGFGMSRLPALPHNDCSDSGTYFDVGTNQDLAAFLSHLPITLSYSPSRSQLPEDRILDLWSGRLSHQRPDECEEKIFTKGQNYHFDTEEITVCYGFGSDTGCKFLLPWDLSSETELLVDQVLQCPREERFISSSFLGKENQENFMEDCCQRDSSGRFDRRYVYLHSPLHKDVLHHF